MTKMITPLSVLAILTVSSVARGPGPMEIGASEQAVGSPGVVWYTTWDTALKEAKRSQRPIFFMAAAAQCNGISGVFWPGYAKTQNSLFATEEFIESSRKFVCVRLETFESKEHQDMVRTFLNGRFENTAFCILAPDGKKRLSGTGRSPRQGFGAGRSGPDGQNETVIKKMDEIAARYPAKGREADAVVQDFHSFKQALNIASGDQRLLVFVVAARKEREALKKSMKQVANHPDEVGLYHYDFADFIDAKWTDKVEGENKKTGIFIIQSGQFGQDGEVIAELPLGTKPDQIRQVLKKENQKFAKIETRKVYSDHVIAGRRKGVKYTDNMPWGEDRDADGKIDERRRRH